MKNQPIQSFRVLYDVQKNKYYRINKTTGQIVPSFKTGKTPAKFDPEITGTNYISRKFKVHNNIRSNQLFQSKDYEADAIEDVRKHTIDPSNDPCTSHTQTEPADYSGTLRKKEQIKKEQNKRLRKSEFHTIQHQSQNIMPSLPRIKKQNSLSTIEVQVISQRQNSSVRNSQGNSDYLNSSFKRQKKIDNSLLNSITKLTAMKGQSKMSQSRMDIQKFENKLKTYAQMQESKTQQSSFHLTNDQKSNQRVKKYGDVSLVTSILDDNFTINQTSRLNISTINHERINSLITKHTIREQVQNMSKQKTSLLLLAKKCQQPNTILKSKIFASKLSEKNARAIQDTLIAQRKKLSNQLGKQKQTFLQFYPEHIHKQNPRIIQEQKERKINFKKLQRLFLQNNQKKYGKIYRSIQTFEDDEPKKQHGK